MDTRLIAANPADVETKCLVVFALDHATKDGAKKDVTKSNQAATKEQPKPEPRLALTDSALEKAVAELVASGEVTGKAFETVILHRPQGLKAKRLLVVGAGKSKTFTHAEVRKLPVARSVRLNPRRSRAAPFWCPISRAALKTRCEPSLKVLWLPTLIPTPIAAIAKT